MLSTPMYSCNNDKTIGSHDYKSVPWPKNAGTWLECPVAYLAPRVHKRQLLELSIKMILVYSFWKPSVLGIRPMYHRPPRHRYHDPSDSADPLTWSVESIIHMSFDTSTTYRFRPCMSVSMLRMVRVNVSTIVKVSSITSRFLSIISAQFWTSSISFSFSWLLSAIFCCAVWWALFPWPDLLLAWREGGVHMEDSCARSRSASNEDPTEDSDAVRGSASFSSRWSCSVCWGWGAMLADWAGPRRRRGGISAELKW
jgi:hypothetical protein